MFEMLNFIINSILASLESSACEFHPQAKPVFTRMLSRIRDLNDDYNLNLQELLFLLLDIMCCTEPEIEPQVAARLTKYIDGYVTETVLEAFEERRERLWEQLQVSDLAATIEMGEADEIVAASLPPVLNENCVIVDLTVESPSEVTELNSQFILE